MFHLRLVVPSDVSLQTLALMRQAPSVCNVVFLEGVATQPDGDVILADVAREDVSVIISDLRELEVHSRGSIMLHSIETAISEAAAEAERAAEGMPSDAVVWEEVESRTSENTELSASFVAFMTLAMLIAGAGIVLDQTILIIGAMILGPDFGPVAGFCVAVVELRKELARRSIAALAAGFAAGIVAVFVATLLMRAADITPSGFSLSDHPFTQFISKPDFFSVYVAIIAGVAGVLSLTSAKSGALIGVLVSVTTIPAASNIGVAAAFGDWGEMGGAAEQLGLNITSMMLAGITTLWIQRRWYVRRRKHHLMDPARKAAGLPLGRSARGSIVMDVEEIRREVARRDSRPPS